MIALRVEHLSKSYRIAHQANGVRPGHRTLREDLMEVPQRLLSRLKPSSQESSSSPRTEEFTALHDVNFEVQQGEVLGIIGRNGAGKSTLLKILSRITEPTSGNVQIFGRVASLLEVGTGFHPELTGRENIYLNGAILGMRRIEITRKFDEIVDFAEVERFLDTPVKRYSSGMYVRLAFAVAAHLEPEILIVDEVLAVGDAQFQKKCLGKMRDVSQAGNRTVLFVSHQMSAIQSLCSRTIVLAGGKVVCDAPSADAVRFYLNDLENRTITANLRDMRRTGSGAVRLTGFRLQDALERPLTAVGSGDEVNIVLDYESDGGHRIGSLSVGLSIHDLHGSVLSIFYNDYAGQEFNDVLSTGRIICTIPDFPFSPGRYYVGARLLANGLEADWPQDLFGVLDVEAGDFYGAGPIGQHGIGPILLRCDWQIRGLTPELSTINL